MFLQRFDTTPKLLTLTDQFHIRDKADGTLARSLSQYD